MSAVIKLSSKLPGDEEINGLDAIVDHFKDSEEPVLVLAWVVSKQVTRITGTDEEVPTVEVRRVEPIGTTDELPQTVIDLAAELYERRTGRNPLPIGDLLAPAGDVEGVWADDGDEVGARSGGMSSIGDALADVAERIFDPAGDGSVTVESVSVGGKPVDLADPFGDQQ